MILVSFLFSLTIILISTILTEMKVEDGTINWVKVTISILTWLLSSLPLLAAALGIPAWGTEQIVYKSKKIGTDRTNKLLDVARAATKKIDPETVDQIIDVVPDLQEKDKPKK